jgi:hypothetical protein
VPGRSEDLARVEAILVSYHAGRFRETAH